MEPRIQYAKTKDGVSIAFWTLGEGEPFVTMPYMPFSRLDTDWLLGREVEFVRYPGGFHTYNTHAPSQRLDGMKRTRDWYDRHAPSKRARRPRARQRMPLATK